MFGGVHPPRRGYCCRAPRTRCIVFNVIYNTVPLVPAGLGLRVGADPAMTTAQPTPTPRMASGRRAGGGHDGARRRLASATRHRGRGGRASQDHAQGRLHDGRARRRSPVSSASGGGVLFRREALLVSGSRREVERLRRMEIGDEHDGTQEQKRRGLGSGSFTSPEPTAGRCGCAPTRPCPRSPPHGAGASSVSTNSPLMEGRRVGLCRLCWSSALATLRSTARPTGRSPSTIVQKKLIIEYYLKPRVGSRRLDQVTDSDVQKLKADLRDLSPKTTNNALVCLNTMLKCGGGVARHRPDAAHHQAAQGAEGPWSQSSTSRPPTRHRRGGRTIDPVDRAPRPAGR